MTSRTAPILFVLDFNVGNETDDPESPYGSGRIAIGSGNGGELKTLLAHEFRPDGIDLSLEDGGRLYWGQMGNPKENDGVVQSSKLDGTDIRDLFTAGSIHTPKQVVVDQPTQKLYVCDREGLRVHRCNFDGSNKEVLVQRGDWRDAKDMANSENWCVGVCVDAEHGYFYWTQKGPSKGGRGRILRAGIDTPIGQNADSRTDIETLFENLPEPIDLEMDTTHHMLYWTDRGDFPKGNTLNRANVSGSVGDIQANGYQIIVRHLHEAIGLKLDLMNDHVYITDMGGCIYRYNIDGGNGVKIFEGQGVFTGLTLAHLEAEDVQALYGRV